MMEILQEIEEEHRQDVVDEVIESDENYGVVTEKFEQISGVSIDETKTKYLEGDSTGLMKNYTARDEDFQYALDIRANVHSDYGPSYDISVIPIVGTWN